MLAVCYRKCRSKYELLQPCIVWCPHTIHWLGADQPGGPLVQVGACRLRSEASPRSSCYLWFWAWDSFLSSQPFCCQSKIPDDTCVLCNNMLLIAGQHDRGHRPLSCNSKTGTRISRGHWAAQNSFLLHQISSITATKATFWLKCLPLISDVCFAHFHFVISFGNGSKK